MNARLLAGHLNEDGVRAGLDARGIAIPAGTLLSPGCTTWSRTMSGCSKGRRRRAIGRNSLVVARRCRKRESCAGSNARRHYRGGGPDVGASRPRLVRDPAGMGAGGVLRLHRRAARADLWSRSRRSGLPARFDWRQYEGAATLEQILSAPVVVASWIALQYHGSAVAPETFGAGNKLLHNVGGAAFSRATAGLFASVCPGNRFTTAMRCATCRAGWSSRSRPRKR